MSTLKQLKHGLNRAWESVTEGWRELVDRAGDALTRFHPVVSSDDSPSQHARIAQRSSRWGVLAAEVSVDDDVVEINIEMPGMDLDDFDIRVVDDVLVVRGEKRVQRECQEGRLHVMERAYGAFERAVRLPVPVEEARSQAKYRKGVLHIALPRSETHRTRRIHVTQG